MAYGKVFESLYTGSMVGAGLSVFAVWTYVIANAKPPGTIELNPILMAAVFGCSPAEVDAAIEKLCAPDPRSRSKEHDGRRLIAEGEFLYSIPTWEKYNSIRNEIERRAQNREAQKRWRERKQSKPQVSSGKQSQPPSAHEDADGDGDGEVPVQNAPSSRQKRAVARPDDVDEQVWFDWITHRKGLRASVTETALTGLRREATKAGFTLSQVLGLCVQNGWRGFKAEWNESNKGKVVSNGTRTTGIHTGFDKIDYGTTGRKL